MAGFLFVFLVGDLVPGFDQRITSSGPAEELSSGSEEKILSRNIFSFSFSFFFPPCLILKTFLLPKPLNCGGW